MSVAPGADEHTTQPDGRPAMIERWALARESTNQFCPFQLIGASDVTALRFEWLGGRQRGVERPPPGSALTRKWFGPDDPATEAPARLFDESELTLRVSIVCHDRTADVGS